jgi:hypothetical protein
VENINSVLAGYFYLRRSHVPEFLHLLQFYLHHRRFRRSECPERGGKSPLEHLTGQSHSYWLELLGYPSFQFLNRPIHFYVSFPMFCPNGRPLPRPNVLAKTALI